MLIPPAPEIPSDAYLEVFVHPSGVPYVDPTSRFSNVNRRLEELGRKMVDLAYMDVMFTQWPRSLANELSTLVTVTENGFMERAVTTYQWKSLIRGAPPGIDKESTEESIRIFRTYAGAVHVAHGYDVLRDWIKALATI
ncbi:hypothetical protein C2E23DRAFT_863124 [Lenzites betulinus]|nr:hypothetical protein C2E23DRAFT_863124 [Lenzites betulinus]